jgi:hypothetical protein
MHYGGWLNGGTTCPSPDQTGGQDRAGQQQGGHFVTIELNLFGIHFY